MWEQDFKMDFKDLELFDKPNDIKFQSYNNIHNPMDSTDDLGRLDFDADDFLQSMLGEDLALPDDFPLHSKENPLSPPPFGNEGEALKDSFFPIVFDSPPASDSGLSGCYGEPSIDNQLSPYSCLTSPSETSPRGSSPHSASPSSPFSSVSSPNFTGFTSPDDASDISSLSDLGSVVTLSPSAAPSPSTPTHISQPPTPTQSSSLNTPVIDNITADDLLQLFAEETSKPPDIPKAKIFNTKISDTENSKISKSHQKSTQNSHIRIQVRSRNGGAVTPSSATTPVVTKVKVESLPPTGGAIPSVVVAKPTEGQQGTEGVRSMVRSANGSNGRSFLVPMSSVKDISQIRTIKIIRTSPMHSNNKSNTTTRVVNPGTTTTTPTSFTSLTTPTIRTRLVQAPRLSSIGARGGQGTPIKEEGEQNRRGHQRLFLSEEERRLMKKEHIVLPSHYPLTKQEERDLKRIRRKIRNKISAQDSRKRKKEYIDGLEDRVKDCTDENQQLQKRIKQLEQQNETLTCQLRRFQGLLMGKARAHWGGGVELKGDLKSRSHASTALMMLILSAALVIVPSLRPNDANESQLRSTNKMPNAGHSRSLLETSSVTNLPLDGLEGIDESMTEGGLFSALSDHDYAPASKRIKLQQYPLPPTDKITSDPIAKAIPPLPGLLKDSPDPPGNDSSLRDMATMLSAALQTLSNNWTDPGGSKNKTEPPLIVNLPTGGVLREELALD